MEEISREDNVNRHPGLTFLVTQSPLQNTAVVVFTRLHKLPLLTVPLSIHLVRNHFYKVKPNMAKKLKHAIFSTGTL